MNEGEENYYWTCGTCEELVTIYEPLELLCNGCGIVGTYCHRCESCAITDDGYCRNCY